MADSPWPTIHAERRALADDLAALTPEQWAAPSLCAGWTVHDVLAHQVATAKLTPAAFVAQFVASGFRFDTFAEKALRRERAVTPDATLAEFRRVASSTSAPPGPKDTWLGEALVHAEDIRRPLGIAREYPLPWVTRALAFYVGSNALIGGKRRVAGLRLTATDTTWSHGSGPEVSGPATSLLLATCGRRDALAELAGPGLELLRAR